MVRRHLWLIPSVALVAIFPFVSGEVLVPVMVLTGIFAIVVLGLDLVMGYTGLWAFGNNAFFAVGAYVSGVLTIKLGFASPLALLVALLFTCIIAYIVGMTSLRLEGLYFGIATLGFSVVVYSLAVGMVDLTSGPVGLRLVPKFSIAGLVFDTETSYFYLVWAALLVLFFFAWNLTHSRTGRALLAIREDQTAAESLGVNSTYYKVMIFVMSAGYASVAGSLFAHYQRVIFPDSFGLGTAIQFFLMLVLGGIGSLWGPILGTSLVRMLPTFLGRMDVYYLLFYGLIFILVIALFPKGLARGVQGLLLKIGQLEVFSRRLRPSPDLEFEAVQVSGRQQGAPVPADAVARAKNPNGPILEARGLVKTFGGLLAVSDLAFAVPRQQLTAIIGPNGAGKTTVLNLITGIYPPTAGKVFSEGREVTGVASHLIAEMGIARTFQIPRLFGQLTALENVMVGRHAKTRAGVAAAALGLPGAWKEEKRVLEDSFKWLSFVGLSAKAHQLAHSLPFGQQRLLDLARALATEPRLLLLDEPAGGLNEAEKEELGRLLLDLQEHGLTILLVEHDMPLVMRLSEKIVVLNYGTKIAEGSPQEVQNDERVITAYLGEERARA